MKNSLVSNKFKGENYNEKLNQQVHTIIENTVPASFFSNYKPFQKLLFLSIFVEICNRKLQPFDIVSTVALMSCNIYNLWACK